MFQILYGPVDGNAFQHNSEYTFSSCLPSGFNYKLTIEDTYGDGLCCDAGIGFYSFLLNGAVLFDSNSEHTFGFEATHEFSVGAVSEPQQSVEVSYDNHTEYNASSASVSEQVVESVEVSYDSNTENNAPSASVSEQVVELQPEVTDEFPLQDPESVMVTPFNGRSSVCGAGMQQIRIDIQFDKYAEENSWELTNIDTGKKVTGEPTGTYQANDFESLLVCLEDGNYRFTIFDQFGNGICCSEGKGYYKLSMDDEIIVYDLFGTGVERSNDFIVGYYKNLVITQRELDYLNEHNTRREYYHKKFGKAYVPLKYSMGLAAAAKGWAETLLDDCYTDGILHDPNRNLQGENLAKAVGSYDEWGEIKSVSNIVWRWVEREETWSYPENLHFSQVLWRASRFMGCGESMKDLGNGKMCRVQVCRYTRPGNCAVVDGLDLQEKMLDDYSQCGYACPPEGCF